jgi:hypothetical protein
MSRLWRWYARSRSPSPTRRRSYTKSFERYALELSRRMTIRDVALHLDVSWDVIKDIQKRDLSRRYAKPKLKHLRRIAIDEIAVAKGHRYLTVVLDLDSGAVVFVGDGKGADALKPFWKRLRPSKARSRRSPWTCRRRTGGGLGPPARGEDRVRPLPCHQALQREALRLRRALYREATDVMHKQVLKGTRWLLLKNPGEPRRGERTRRRGWRRRWR